MNLLEMALSQYGEKEIEGKEIPVGALDITLYRDDLTEVGEQPVAGQDD